MQDSGDIADFSKNIEITTSMRDHIIKKFKGKLISNILVQWIKGSIMCIEDELAGLGMAWLSVVWLKTWWAHNWYVEG